MNLSNANDALAHWARVRPDHIALSNGTVSLTYRRLETLVSKLAGDLEGRGVNCCAILLDNGAGWVVSDLALGRIGAVIVPVPIFFAASQISHALRSAGVDSIIVDRSSTASFASGDGVAMSDAPELADIRLLRMEGPVSAIPGGTHKVTFTSGTTGRPKGVCLSKDGIEQVARSLCDATEGNDADRHLSILPFAALLENIAGIDIPLLAGAECLRVPNFIRCRWRSLASPVRPACSRRNWSLPWSDIARPASSPYRRSCRS